VLRPEGSVGCDGMVGHVCVWVLVLLIRISNSNFKFKF
jgi:hypothetical protein